MTANGKNPAANTQSDVHRIKCACQEILREPFLCWVGAGLSAAQGLPSMQALAEILRDQIRGMGLPSDCLDAWGNILPDLDSLGLEGALLKHSIPQQLEHAIVSVTAEAVQRGECDALRRLVEHPDGFPLGRLLKSLVTANRTIPLVTTNYDRLAEAAVEASGLCVDSLFVGSMFGALDPDCSGGSFFELTSAKGKGRANRKSVRRQVRPHIRVIKPHGSLDWYELHGRTVRSSISLPGRRLIVTPGTSKFRKGYETAFQTHQDEMRRRVKQARSYLILGYGFNDEHLEVTIREELKTGKSALYLTRDLTPSASALIKAHDRILSLSADGIRTRVLGQKLDCILPDSALWNLDQFVSEVCEP